MIISSEIISFIEIIYRQCKKLDIPPAIVPSWIRDLLDCNSNNINSTQSEMKTVPNSISNSSSSGNKMSSEKNIEQAFTLSSHSIEFEIPFVSKVSVLIAQKRKECIQLEKYKLDLNEDIENLKSQKDKIKNNLNQIIQNENRVISYLDWYYELQQDLDNTYGIKIDQDIGDFAKLINDFKEHGYEALEIINKYNKALSLRTEISTKESEIMSLQNQSNSLNNSVSSLISQINIHKQTLDTYLRLEVMKFGIKELQQLWFTILEIAKANNITDDQAVSKFFKDIEEQYDHKLGLEEKVKEKRDELAQVNIELTKSRQIFHLQPFIGSTLFNLFQKGVGEQDIIGINQLTREFTYSSLYDNIDSNGKTNHDEDVKGNSNRSVLWKSLIDELKE